jgi:putative sterol carrier protein
VTVRFYSPDWIAAFNDAVSVLEPVPGPSFRMLQVVHGGPDGTFEIALVVDDGHVVLERDLPVDASPQVTVSVSYDDAAGLSRGELEPAQLVASGRLKVRGDLSVLVSGQELLTAAAARLATLSEATTY